VRRSRNDRSDLSFERTSDLESSNDDAYGPRSKEVGPWTLEARHSLFRKG
jgi:hypothetical protein